MRLNARHFVVAIIFMFAQIVAYAAVYDHMGDPLHTGDDCAVCTTVTGDTDDDLPPITPQIIHPLMTTQPVAPARTQAVLPRQASPQKARAPPASA